MTDGSMSVWQDTPSSRTRNGQARVAALSVQILVSIAIVFGALFSEISMHYAAASVLFVMTLRLSEPLSSINLIGAYWFITFIVVPPRLVPSMVDTLTVHYIIIQSIIFLSYWVGRVFWKTRLRGGDHATPPIPTGAHRRYQQFLLIAFSIAAVGTLIQIVTVGPENWFSGGRLAERITQYSSFDRSETISRAFMLIINWTFFVAYVLHRHYGFHFPTMTKAGALLGVPLINLARSTFIFNLFFLMMASRRRVGTLAIVTSVAVIMAAGLGLGLLRASNLTALGQGTEISDLFVGEFSSSIVYSDIIRYGDEIGLQYGVPIIGPVITSPIPRSLWHDKPQNGSAIYMQYFYPEELKAGFSFASNCFSDAYLNFGMIGVILLAVIMGFSYGGVDLRRELGRLSVIDFLLLFNIYSIMRTAMAVPLSFMLMQFILYFIVKAYVLPGHAGLQKMRVGHRSQPPGIPVALPKARSR